MIEAYPTRLVVDVHGVGYEVIVPLSTFDRLHAAEGIPVDLRTHLHFGTANQPGQKLFGFATEEERDVFLMLVERVSGIGPSVALAVLSGMPVWGVKLKASGTSPLIFAISVDDRARL